MSNNENVVTEQPVSANPTSAAAKDVVTDDKIEQFRTQVAELKLKTGRTRGDLVRQVLGGILMLGGLIGALIVYEQSLSEGSALNLASDQILTIVFIGVILIGAALFVSAAVARFLRIWMLRSLYEGQAQVDQLVERLGR